MEWLKLVASIIFICLAMIYMEVEMMSISPDAKFIGVCLLCAGFCAASEK